MKNKYSFQAYDEKTMARARGVYLPVSRKDCFETARFIRGRPVNWAITYLEKVIAKKAAVPHTRFMWDMGHKRGMASGRYPKKAATYIIQILNSAKKIAEGKGLKADKLEIVHLSAYKGPVIRHYGRKQRERRITNMEVVVAEIKEETKLKKEDTKEKTTQNASVSLGVRPQNTGGVRT